MKRIFLALLTSLLAGCSSIQPASYVVSRACELDGSKSLLAKETLDDAVYPHRVTVECFAYTEGVENGRETTTAGDPTQEEL